MHNGIPQTTKAIPFLASRPRARTKDLLPIVFASIRKGNSCTVWWVASCSVPFAFVFWSLARASLQPYVHVSRPRAILALQDQYCNKEHYTQYPPLFSHQQILIRVYCFYVACVGSSRGRRNDSEGAVNTLVQYTSAHDHGDAGKRRTGNTRIAESGFQSRQVRAHWRAYYAEGSHSDPCLVKVYQRHRTKTESLGFQGRAPLRNFAARDAVSGIRFNLQFKW